MFIAVPAYADNNEPHQALVQSGLVLFQRGDYVSALQRFEAALPNIPTDPFLNAYVGFSYAKLARYADAAKSYERALALRPSYLNAQINLCTVYAKLNELGKALLACEKAAEMDRQSALTLNDLGLIQFQLGRFPEAKRSFERVIAMDPALAVAHHNLAETYASLQQMSKAVESELRAIKAQRKLCRSVAESGPVL